MVWLLLLFALVLWFVTYKISRRNMYKLASLVPAPIEELPIVGIAHTLTGSPVDIMETLQNFSYASFKFNGILRAWLVHLLYIVVTNPVDLEMILKNCLDKDNLHRFLRKITGNGGVFAPVSIWRRRRKIIIQAFRPKITENFVEVFSEQGEILVKKLEPRVGTGTFNLWPYISTYTLDSVSETAMGVKLHSQDDSKTPFLQAMTSMLNLVCQRIFHLWLQPDWLYKFMPQYVMHEKNKSILHDYTDQVIKTKREEFEAEHKSRPESEQKKDYDLDGYKRKSFLDLLISLSGGEKGYTNIELREEVLTLTVAGTDTSAASMGYTLLLLGKYPDVQEKVYQELYDVFGDSDRPLVKEDLLKLKHLERVVKESLRLYPPVPFIIRKALEDTKLPSGYVLPSGSGVVVSIWGVHRDPKYWGPDAEKFDPDRFLPERFKLEHSCSFMPFSNGPRNCVGYQYALMSMKTALSAVLRRYRVVVTEDALHNPYIKVKLDVMMKAVDEYQVALERRAPKTLKSNEHVA
ncbi:cytochrome P450 4C1-like [Hyposmocoma kahamanoa]|uniref:cytochrome P450 4C1-like n=1 Tax=Hyposmocoma kahamanoa TaxID=1477025 RepID=UPI000E6D88DE|nr:cytochrome P450 4C1-like [Hyposmocoma kahamanoa]